MADDRYVWRVFKYADDRTDNTWREVGEMESEYAYGGPSVQSLGEKHGPGRFLFVKVGAYDAREISIVATSYYEEAPEREAADESEAVTA